MSWDITLHIHRKCDDKKLASLNCNTLKNVIDSSCGERIGCTGRIDSNKTRFEYSDLEDAESVAYEKLKQYYNQIFEKKLMIMSATSVEVKRELEEDIRYIETEDIENINICLSSISFVKGAINAIVEDTYVKTGNKTEDGEDEEVLSYEAFGNDLPSEKHSFTDLSGRESTYETRPYVMVKDVYFVIESD